MKLAFSTLGCPEWTFEQVCDHALRMGYQAVEVRGIRHELRSELIDAFLPENARDSKETLAAQGLSLCALGTSVNFDIRTDRAAALDEARQAALVCRRMGIPYFRVFGNAIHPAESVDSAVLRVTEGIEQMLALLSDVPVCALLEVHGDFDRVERLLPIMQKIDDPQLGILWDIQHSHAIYGDQFEAFFQPLKPYIRHVHIKDSKEVDGERKLCPVGEGDLPIAGIVKMLKKNGYGGYCSLEWEKRWHPELAEPERVFPEYVRWMNAL